MSENNCIWGRCHEQKVAQISELGKKRQDQPKNNHTMIEGYGIIWVKSLHELKALARREGESAEGVHQSSETLNERRPSLTFMVRLGRFWVFRLFLWSTAPNSKYR